MSEGIQIKTGELEWRSFPDVEGVKYKTLRKHETGGLSILLKFDPGARYHTHRHPGGEEYYVVEGVLDDLGQSWAAGSYIWHPPGSVHRPGSASGCVVLVNLPEAVEVLGG